MTLSNAPPAGAGKVKHTTKTDLLIQAIKRLGNDRFGNPVGIRTYELAQATDVPANSIQVLLVPAVKRGEIYVCKVSVPGRPPQNEYRIGGGVAAPEFKPLIPKRAGAALGTPGRRNTTTTAATPLSTLKPAEAATPTFLKPQPAVGNTGSSRPDSSVVPAGARTVTAKATPKPAAGVRLKEESMTPKASAGDAAYYGALDISIDHEGTLIIGTVESVIELPPEHTRRLGNFLLGSQGVWNPF
jgi:hypothetical protein